MIRSLMIKNIVLIENITIDFYPGMNVLTGETGAGKSILVDAVVLALGGRMDRSLIRTGCERASVEAVFEVPSQSEVFEILDRENIECDNGFVTIYREISSAGRNICRICGVLVSVSLLKEVGEKIMDIHGQHDQVFLLNPEQHLNFLDRLGDESYHEQLQKTMSAFSRFLEIHRKLVRLRKEDAAKQSRISQLEKELQVLETINLKPDEEDALVSEVNQLRNADKITRALRNAQLEMASGNGVQGCLEKTKIAADSIEKISEYSEEIKQIAVQCNDVYYEMEEILFQISRLIEKIDCDPAVLEIKESRLNDIRRLESKYGPTVANVLSSQAQMKSELEKLYMLETEISGATQKHKELLSEYRNEAGKLTEFRKTLASRIEKEMTEQLHDLGMENAVFKVLFSNRGEGKHPTPKLSGDDEIEFMFSGNPGEPVKSLAKVASGGELSRLMLALKTLETTGNAIDCMVFDEIDTGISGKAAQTVAEKMKKISEFRQVLCVTHLSQIAAIADHQYFVQKEIVSGRTKTVVRELNDEGRIAEIARMISGAEGSNVDAEQYARAMIQANLKK